MKTNKPHNSTPPPARQLSTFNLQFSILLILLALPLLAQPSSAGTLAVPPRDQPSSAGTPAVPPRDQQTSPPAGKPGSSASLLAVSPRDSLWRALEQSEGLEKLRTYQRLISQYDSGILDPVVLDTIMTIYDDYLDEARRQECPNQVATAMTGKIITLLNAKKFDQVLAQAPPVLAYLVEHELWYKYYEFYASIIDAHRLSGNLDTALAEAQRMYTHAKERNDRAGMALMLYSTAELYYRQRRFTEQEEALRQSIDLMADIPECAPHLPTAYTRLISSLNTQLRTDEARLLIPQATDAIYRYEATTGVSQPSAWNNLWLRLIGLGLRSGDYDSAEFYLNKLDSLRGGTIDLYEERATIYYGREQYAEALEAIEKSIALKTLENGLMSSMSMKLLIQMKLGDADGSYDTFVATVHMLDSVNRARAKVQVDDLRTQYEVDRHIAEKERNRNYYLIALAGCIMLLALLGVAVYYNRIIRRKNRRLYHYIKEAGSRGGTAGLAPLPPAGYSPLAGGELPGYGNEDTAGYSDPSVASRHLPTPSPLRGTPPLQGESPEPAGYGNQTTPRHCEGAPEAIQNHPQDYLLDCHAGEPARNDATHLLHHLNTYLTEADNLATVDLNREDLAAALGTNRSTLADAVKSLTGRTLMEYIRTIQLEEARRMLDASPHLTIEAIATDCGFKATSTFYRLFRKQYGISPSEYRKFGGEEDGEEE